MSNRYTPRNRDNQLGLNSRRIGALEREKNPAVAGAVAPYYNAVTNLAGTRTLLGSWRLGEGASPYLDTSGDSRGSADGSRTVTGTAMSLDVTGALPTADDDGAVQFNAAGVAGDYLDCLEFTTRRFNLTNTDYPSNSLAAWVYPTSSASTFQGAVVHQYLNGGASGNGWAMLMNWPARTIQFTRSGNAATTNLVGPALPASTWTYVVCTYSTTDGHKIYLNGSLVASDSTLTAGLPSFNNGPYIGGGSSVTSVWPFYGRIDEVSIWGAALTASEVATLSSSGGVASSASHLVTTATAYTATASDTYILASGTTTITLPTAVGISGSTITIKNTGVATITVARTSSETIDGTAANVTMATTKQARAFTSDGAGWQMTAAYL